MKILIFGASGMVGQGVLRECLAAADVSQIVTVGRTPLTQAHPKLQQLVHADLMRLDARKDELRGFDACFFCLGVSSSGMDENTYQKITYELTLTVAKLLAELNLEMTFVYVSGAGTDSSEQGRSMWARVKGKTENDLKKLPFRSIYLFRPSIIQPLHGAKSKTAAYRYFYNLSGPLLSLIRRLFPSFIVTTDDVGQAMLNAARQTNQRVLVAEAHDIARLSRGAHL
ncbi:NAD-dependent epimerase/dehydratase family protein [Iodobacter ciconiae]|uniref:NAD-dependent epimerase/dehydratase family protein n=1 Tax=Iodobacter ciconiae TaxID=2496266 RepID=A0A3S8ZPC1_9NEIS|nr:NAD-dependent epimerase/dehydratase family protein [Iodobacter ciconiae]AZN35312.1 NAD-dependent epimerase/dehydratase family protein [Iodobacter ciconiae]